MVAPDMCSVPVELKPSEEKRESSLRQDMTDAWEDYRTTGLHVPAEEVEEWIARWWSENELPVPEYALS
jgi:predicted transcriptional regulator